MKTCTSCNGRKSHHNPSTHDDEMCLNCNGTGYQPEPAPVAVITPAEFLKKREELRPRADVNAVNEALKIINEHLLRGQPDINFDGRVYSGVFGIDRDQRELNVQEVINVLKNHGWLVETVSRQDGFTFKLAAKTQRSPAITRSGNSG